MSLAEKIEKLIGKINGLQGQVLSLAKKVNTLEERESIVMEGCGFMPNEKFLSWYEGTFADSEDDMITKEEAEEYIEKKAKEVEVEEIPEELNNKLDELLEDEGE